MSFRSPYPDVEIPARTLYDHLFADLGDAADRVALIDGASGATTTYGQLRDQIDALAGGLSAAGVRPDDVVAILCPNISAFVSVFHGILRAGAVATTINSLYTAHEIAEQLSDAHARSIVTVSACLAQVREAANAVGLGAADVILIDAPSDSPHTALADLLTTGAAPPVLDVDPARQLAVLPYSSGTTGKAKGVMLTHRNLVANLMQSTDLIGVHSDDRVLCVLPFFHIYGMNVLMNGGLQQRATLVTMPRFELAEFLRVIADHQASFVFIAPPIAVALAKHPLVDAYDLSSLRIIFSGAAPLDSGLGHTVAHRLGCAVRQGYGMTEMSPVSHVIPHDRDDIPLATVGPVIPNMECRLVDPATGAEIEPPKTGVSEAGELWCRGPNVMVGYLGNLEATDAMLDADGYLHTGDVATLTAEGYVTLVDRVKELIKYKGYQVPPAELEGVLLTHAEIADSAVVGVIAEDGEEVPKAFVVRQSGSSLTAEQVMAYVADRVAPYKKVRQVEFVDAIPKSSSGKILRRQLRRPRQELGV